METVYLKADSIRTVDKDISCAIGNFDGVHLGHQQLIAECKKHGKKSAVFTFNPHPSVFIKKIRNYPLLTPLEIKSKIIASLGVDYLIILEFSEMIARMSKTEFMKMLKTVGITSVVCGYDFTFGYKAEGRISDLKEYFTVYEIKKYLIDDIRVGSTYIRELLEDGNVKEANRLLGRPYTIIGSVIYGTQHGRLIGFPTANVEHNGYFLPKNGVYAAKVKYDGKEYLGMCNIGHNPTFNFAEELRLEVHIFDFDGDIYNEIIELSFLDHIRNEIKFASVDELKDQLIKDKALCRSQGGR